MRVVRLIRPKGTRVPYGALAIAKRVGTYPALLSELIDRVGVDAAVEFIPVEWVEKGIGQNGYYYRSRFQEIECPRS